MVCEIEMFFGMQSIPYGTGVQSIPYGTGMRSIPYETGMQSIPYETVIPTGGTPKALPKRRNLAANGRHASSAGRCLDCARHDK